MIRVTTRYKDDDYVETYKDIDALEEDLAVTAEPGYAEAILVKLRSGEQTFDMANGPDIDTYEVLP